MKADRSVYCDLSLYDYGAGTSFPHPRDIATPATVVQRVDIPQSLYDSWWLLLEFETAQAMDTFMEFPPKVFQRAKFAIRPQDFFDKWAPNDARAQAP